MKYILTIILLTMVAAGCTEIKEFVRPVVVTRVVPSFRAVEPTHQRPVTWVVINKSNAEEKLSEIESATGRGVVIGITPEGYENLSLNMADLRRIIEQQGSIIVSYKEYLEGNAQDATNK